MKLYAPNGLLIIGTLEIVHGGAGLINDSITREPDGTFQFQYAGGTEVFWDGQRTVTRIPRDGSGRTAQRVFLDEDNGEHLECDLMLLEHDPEDVEQAMADNNLSSEDWDALSVEQQRDLIGER